MYLSGLYINIQTYTYMNICYVKRDLILSPYSEPFSLTLSIKQCILFVMVCGATFSK